MLKDSYQRMVDLKKRKLTLFPATNRMILFFLTGFIMLYCLTDLNIPGGTVYAEETQEPAPDDGSVADPPIYEEQPVVIVIDPGHGGENLGGEYEDYTEKDMTLAVAKAMKEELEKYEGVTVYLTRTDDTDLSLDERCEYAESVGADFMFCLHFNLSEYHTLFGAECWVSAFGENYSKGYSFASIEIGMLQDMGLYSRGIKTRLNDRGIDYYGILRHSVERNFPCVLIEHCHLDQENDKPFYDHDAKLRDFGVLDATAAARYFRLKSDVLGVDYSDYDVPEVAVPSYTVAPDKTEPDISLIEVLDQNMENGDVTVQVSAADYDSGMLYYTYSYDNGEHFSELQRWPDKSVDTFSFTMNVPPHIIPQIVVNAYNGYDLYTTSNMIPLPSMDYKTEEEIAAELAEKEALESASKAVESSGVPDSAGQQDRIENVHAGGSDADQDRPVSFGYFLAVCIVCALLVLSMILSVILILRGRKKRPRRRRRRG